MDNTTVSLDHLLIDTPEMAKLKPHWVLIHLKNYNIYKRASFTSGSSTDFDSTTQRALVP